MSQVRWPVVVYLSCGHFKLYPADDAPSFGQLVRCEDGCGPVAAVESASVLVLRCVHDVRLDVVCTECEAVIKLAGEDFTDRAPLRWRLVEPPPISRVPGELAKVVETEANTGSGPESPDIAYEMLEVEPGVRRTPLTSGKDEQAVLLRLARLAPPDAEVGVHGDVLMGQGARGAAKLALVMKDAMALGLVELTSPKGDPYLYRLTAKGADEVERIRRSR